MPAPYGTGRWELFDIATDPAERHDLAGQDPVRLKRMKAEWQRWANRSNVILPDWVTGY
jgi:arylsulfatase